MEQDSTNNHLALVKTNRVSKSTLSVQMQKLCFSYHKYNGSSEKYHPFIILVMLLSLRYFSDVFENRINNFETSQLSKMKNIINQIASKQ